MRNRKATYDIYPAKVAFPDQVNAACDWFTSKRQREYAQMGITGVVLVTSDSAPTLGSALALAKQVNDETGCPIAVQRRAVGQKNKVYEIS